MFFHFFIIKLNIIITFVLKFETSYIIDEAIQKIYDHNFNNIKYLNEFKTDLFFEKVANKTIIYYNFLM